MVIVDHKLVRDSRALAHPRPKWQLEFDNLSTAQVMSDSDSLRRSFVQSHPSVNRFELV